MAGISTVKLSLFPPIRSSFSPKPSFPVLRHSLTLPRRNRVLKIYSLSSNDIKVGTSLEVDGAPWKVLEFLHVKPGKGAAFVRTKMRNYLTGNTVEKTFRAGSPITPANVTKDTKQFTYKDGDMYVFMDLTTYEECRLSEKEIGDNTKWLKEGMECNIQFWNGKPIDVELPLLVKLSIADTEPGVKGDSVQSGGGTKQATLETGVVVNVPLFINIGDEIMVDIRSGQYTSRA